MKSLSDWKKKCSKEQCSAGTVYQELTCIMGLGATTLTAAGLPIPAHMLVRPLFCANGEPADRPRPSGVSHRGCMGETEDIVRTRRDARFHPSDLVIWPVNR